MASERGAEGGESAGLARSAGVVAAGTLVSRVLGAVRDVVIAACFPLVATDAFFVAFTIPNALRGLLAEGAVSSAFVPVYSEVRASEGDAPAKRFYASLSGAMLAILAIVSVLGVLAAPLLVTAYASGYADDPALFGDTVTLTRIVFPYIFLMGAAALGTGALNAHRRFAVPALAPALLNVALIAAPFALAGTVASMGLPPIASLALGALAGGALQVVAQWPALARLGLLSPPRFDLADARVKKALGLLVPLTIGLGVYQLNVMFSRLLVSYLPEGSQSYLYYGQRLVEIPQGMLALAIASAALPTLSDLRNRGAHDELVRVFGYALRSSLFVSVPATVLLVVLAEPTVVTLFQRGAFDRSAALETARSLAWQGAGVWAIASVRVIVPLFYAHNDTRTPLVGGALNLGVFVALGLGLRGSMGHAGVALAISAAGAVQMIVLLGLLRRKMGRLGLAEVARSALRLGVAAGVMGVVAAGVASLGAWERGGNDVVNVLVWIGAALAAALTYAGVLHLLRAPELRELGDALRRRVRRT